MDIKRAIIRVKTQLKLYKKEKESRDYLHYSIAPDNCHNALITVLKHKVLSSEQPFGSVQWLYRVERHHGVFRTALKTQYTVIHTSSTHIIQ